MVHNVQKVSNCMKFCSFSRRPISVFITATQVRWIQFTSYFFLLLSSYLCLGFPVAPSNQIFWLKLCMYFSFLHACYMYHPFHLPWISLTNETWKLQNKTKRTVWFVKYKNYKLLPFFSFQVIYILTVMNVTRILVQYKMILEDLHSTKLINVHVKARNAAMLILSVQI